MPRDLPRMVARRYPACGLATRQSQQEAVPPGNRPRSWLSEPWPFVAALACVTRSRRSHDRGIGHQVRGGGHPFGSHEPATPPAGCSLSPTPPWQWGRDTPPRFGSLSISSLPWRLPPAHNTTPSSTTKRGHLSADFSADERPSVPQPGAHTTQETPRYCPCPSVLHPAPFPISVTESGITRAVPANHRGWLPNAGLKWRRERRAHRPRRCRRLPVTEAWDTNSSAPPSHRTRPGEHEADRTRQGIPHRWRRTTTRRGCCMGNTLLALGGDRGRSRPRLLLEHLQLPCDHQQGLGRNTGVQIRAAGVPQHALDEWTSYDAPGFPACITPIQPSDWRASGATRGGRRCWELHYFQAR